MSVFHFTHCCRPSIWPFSGCNHHVVTPTLPYMRLLCQICWSVLTYIFRYGCHQIRFRVTSFTTIYAMDAYMFVSLLSHFWLIHLFHLCLLYQPYLGLCQAPCVQSHQRQPMSAVAITACEVQVSAADCQTVPTVVIGVSKPLCCRLTLTFTLTSENLSLCTTLILLILLVLIQLYSPRCWHLDSNYCRTSCRQSQLRFVLSPLLLHPRLLETFQSDIPLFTWLGQLSTVLTKDEALHKGYTFTPWGCLLLPLA